MLQFQKVKLAKCLDVFYRYITLFQAVILLPDKESPEGGEDNRFGFEILK